MQWFKMNQSDILALIKFDVMVHPEEDRPSRQDYLKAFDGDMTFYAFKEHLSDQDYVATFQIKDMMDEGTQAIIFTGVGVHPDYKGKGFGHVIMQELEKIAKGKMLYCKTRESNTPMIALLESHGFENVMDEMKGGYWKCWSKMA